MNKTFKTLSVLAITFTSALLLSACSSAAPKPTENDENLGEDINKTKIDTVLEHTYWGDSKNENPLGAHLIFVNDENGLAAYGTDGCNNIRTNVNIDDNKLIFNGFASTMMACMDLPAEPWLGLAESSILTDDNEKMVFYNADNEEIGTLHYEREAHEEEISIDVVENPDESVSNENTITDDAITTDEIITPIM